MTVAEGNASAMSLTSSIREKYGSYSCGELKGLHRPHTSSSSNVENILLTPHSKEWFLNRGRQGVYSAHLWIEYRC